MAATGRSTVLVQKMRGIVVILGRGGGEIENKGSGGSDRRWGFLQRGGGAQVNNEVFIKT